MGLEKLRPLPLYIALWLGETQSPWDLEKYRALLLYGGWGQNTEQSEVHVVIYAQGLGKIPSLLPTPRRDLRIFLSLSSREVRRGTRNRQETWSPILTRRKSWIKNGTWAVKIWETGRRWGSRVYDGLAQERMTQGIEIIKNIFRLVATPEKSF